MKGEIFNGQVKPGMLMGTSAFCMLELFMHTLMGTKMYFKFKDKGKKSIYGPGSITAYWCFVPLGIISLITLKGQTVSTSDWIICFSIIAFIVICCVILPESIIKKKDTPFSFESEGYYKKFL